MKKPKNLSKSVANVVFSPTLLAFIWLVAGYIVAGLALYVVSMFLAYKMWLFENVRRWPRISRAPLYCGPPLLGVGLYLSTQPPSYSMIIPLVVYGALSVAGGLALVGKFNARDAMVE